MSLAPSFLAVEVWSRRATGARREHVLRRVFHKAGSSVSATNIIEVPYEVPI